MLLERRPLKVRKTSHDIIAAPKPAFAKDFAVLDKLVGETSKVAAVIAEVRYHMVREALEERTGETKHSMMNMGKDSVFIKTAYVS